MEIIACAEVNHLVTIMNVTGGQKYRIQNTEMDKNTEIQAGRAGRPPGGCEWWMLRVLKTNTQQFAVDISH